MMAFAMMGEKEQNIRTANGEVIALIAMSVTEIPLNQPLAIGIIHLHHHPQVFENTCSDSYDGYGEHGPGAMYDSCDYGTDCADCGDRAPDEGSSGSSSASCNGEVIPGSSEWWKTCSMISAEDCADGSCCCPTARR